MQGCNGDVVYTLIVALMTALPVSDIKDIVELGKTVIKKAYMNEIKHNGEYYTN